MAVPTFTIHLNSTQCLQFLATTTAFLSFAAMGISTPAFTIVAQGTSLFSFITRTDDDDDDFGLVQVILTQ